MKKLKYLLLAVPFAITLNSCDSDEQVDELIDSVERGAILRTVEIFSNELPIGVADAEFSVRVEEQDEEDGGLLQSVDIFVSFTDGSPDDGDSSGAITGDVMVSSIGADQFENGPNGLPRATITVTLDAMLAALNLTADDLFGGDVFRTRLQLNLTDGRSFTNDGGDNVDVNGNVASGSFFLSPFFYNSNVVCPVPDEYLIGDYLMERISTTEDPFFPSFGQAIADQPVTITGSGAARSFVFSYFPTGFDFPQVMNLTLSCNNFLVMGTAESGTLGCGDGSIGQSTPEVPSQYDLSDDSVVEIDFLDFEPDAGCGTGNYPVTILLTRQ